eukprot:3940592-Rhodomonas_salina.2
MHRTCVRLRYAMPGSDIAYGATSGVALALAITRPELVGYYAICLRDPRYQRSCYATPGADIATRYVPVLSICALARSPVLTYRIGLRACYAIPGTDLPYAPPSLSNSDTITEPTTGLQVHPPPRALRTRHAMSGTDVDCAPTLCP